MQRENNQSISRIRKAALMMAMLILTHFVFSQKTDTTKTNYNFGGAVTLTNNGISLLPTFSLEKPA